MQPFIDKVRRLVAGAEEETKWSDEALAEVRFVLANGLHCLGEERGDKRLLEEAVTVYREVLVVLVRELYPQQRAGTQNSLGTALTLLGEHESSAVRLEEAVVAFREALTEQARERERSPIEWAMTQNNLGNVLTMLGWREPTTDRLKEAVTAYREALKEFTQQRAPLEWAMTQTQLAHSLTSLGRRAAIARAAPPAPNSTSALPAGSTTLRGAVRKPCPSVF
jgi:tetratricopeptide (TPR) repeat protein